MSATMLAIQSETVSHCSTQALVTHIVDTLSHALTASLKELEPYIREVWHRLDNGEIIEVGKDKYRTRQEFCDGVLHRTYRAVHYMLNGGNQKRVSLSGIQAIADSKSSAIAVAPLKPYEPNTRGTNYTLQNLAEEVRKQGLVCEVTAAKSGDIKTETFAFKIEGAVTGCRLQTILQRIAANG